MNGAVNSVLAYLAARSRGDSSFGAPGETGAAPPLRPRPTAAQAGDSVDGLRFDFIEETLEIERDTPPPRPPTADPEPEIIPGLSVRAAASAVATIPSARAASATETTETTEATEATTPVIAQTRAPPQPPPLSQTLLADSAAPIQASARATSPLSAAPEVRTPPKTKDLSAAPTPPWRPGDRPAPEALEARDPAEAQAPPAAPPTARPAAGPPQADPPRPPPVIVQREVAVPLTSPAEATAVEARPTPRAERLFEPAREHQRVPREPPSSLAAAPHVQITIGRVEVRAAAPAPPPSPRGPAMSLDDYLARRAGG